MNVMEKASELIKQRIPFALATVVNVKGSSPRSTASKMIILKDKTTFDTVGGGLVEARIIEEAVEAIEKGKPKMLQYRLNANAPGGLAMQCGGDMDIFIDVYAQTPHVIIVGGGHCGYAVAKGVKLLGWDYSVVEERAEYNSRERFPDARNLYTEGNYKELERLECDESTYIVLVTNDHDKQALEKVIMKDAAYIGMIGSKRKVSIVIKELAELGFPQERLDKVCAPIGIEIGAETPEEIAFSIISEIIQLRRLGRS